MRGAFITFEGLDRTGKSTQFARLCDFLRGRGGRFTATREPGGTLLGEKIRHILLDPDGVPVCPRAEALLFAAIRAQHVEEVILPALDSGRHVLCDRFSDSTLAYQGYGAGLDVEALSMLSGFAARGLAPDLTLLFDLGPGAGYGAEEARPDRIERRGEEYRDRVRRGFLDVAGRNPGRVRVIDASGSLDQVQARVRAVVVEFLDRFTEGGGR